MQELQSYVFYGELGPGDETVDFGSVEFVTGEMWAKQSGKYSRRYLAVVSPANMILPEAPRVAVRAAAAAVAPAPATSDKDPAPSKAAGSSSVMPAALPAAATWWVSKTVDAAGKPKQASGNTRSAKKNTSSDEKDEDEEQAPTAPIPSSSSSSSSSSTTAVDEEKKGRPASLPPSNLPKLEIADAFGSGSDNHAPKDGGTVVQVTSI